LYGVRIGLPFLQRSMRVAMQFWMHLDRNINVALCLHAIPCPDVMGLIPVEGVDGV